MNTKKKLNILFLTARLPYPIIGGDRLKPYNIIKHLAKSHNVTLVSFYQGGEAPQEYTKALENLGAEVYAVPLYPIKAALNIFFTSLLKFPLEIGYYTQPKYKKLVDKLLSERNFDLGFSFFMRTAEYLKKEKFKRILMAEDCRTLYQKRSFEDSANIKQKLVRWWEFRMLKKYEPEIANYFDIVTLVTDEDINSMKAQNTNAKYKLLTNGVDIDYFTPPESSNQRNGVLFSGKMDVWANELMVKNIVEEIFPRILNEMPEAKLNIVGANPSKTIKSFQSNSISVTGTVPEVKPYLQNAQLFLHPHIGGSGIQNKLLEAMACECPVVTTPTGIQGIPATNYKDVLIGKDYDELAKHSIKILKNNDFSNQIGTNARKMIVETHSWDSVFISLEKLIEELGL